MTSIPKKAGDGAVEKALATAAAVNVITGNFRRALTALHGLLAANEPTAGQGAPVPDKVHESGKGATAHMGSLPRNQQPPVQTVAAPQQIAAAAKKDRRSNARKLLDLESAQRVEGKPKCISSESQDTLRYISEDFVIDAVTGNPLRISSGKTLARTGFKDVCQQEYGFVVGTDADGRDIRASAGEIWLTWATDHRRTVEEVVMEPTSKTAAQDADERPLVLNRWHVLKQGMVEPDMAATLEDIQILLDHLMYISDGDTVVVMYFLNWLAQLYQTPEVKIPVAILMYSRAGGVGKSILFHLLAAVFAKRMVSCCSGRALTKAFDDVIDGKRILVVNELAKSEKSDNYEHFKSMVSEEDTSFEGKGKAARDIRSITHFIITTNHDDALPLMQGDRRIAVFRCMADPKDADYYVRLRGWINGDGPALLAGVLAQWKFPAEWNPHAHAPQTAAARAMQDAARGALHNNMEQLRVDRIAPFDKDILVVADATTALMEYEALWGCKINTTTVGAVLKRMPLEFVPLKVERAPLPKGAQAPTMRVYLQASDIDWKKATPKQRGDHLNSGVRLFSVQDQSNESEVANYE